MSTQTIRIAGSDGRTTDFRTSILPTATVVEIGAPMDKAWAALRDAYDSLGIPVATVDEGHHLLGNTGFRVRRKLGSTSLTRYLDCGSMQGGPNAETYEVFLAVATQLQPTATTGSTQATTSVQASAKPVSVSGDYVPCSSTGGLESRIEQTVKQIVGR